jgi:predicted nucleic acid-binding protein
MPAAKTRKVSDSAQAVYTVEKPRAFADSNVPLYLLSEDAGKVAKAEAVLGSSCLISVQVLNEVTSVLRRKYQYAWKQIEDFLQLLRSTCLVAPLTEETHDTARRLAERYNFSFYDALIAAAALLAECRILYSEDMQHGLVLEGRLRIVNPFI